MAPRHAYPTNSKWAVSVTYGGGSFIVGKEYETAGAVLEAMQEQWTKCGEGIKTWEHRKVQATGSGNDSPRSYIMRLVNPHHVVTIESIPESEAHDA